MFIVFTADDAIQSYTLDSVNQFLGHRKNPNGCAPKMTYFTSLGNTNYSLVTGACFLVALAKSEVVQIGSWPGMR
jgi:hypothetical protein